MLQDEDITYREDLGNTLRVLIATDCHLGYMEKDEIRRFDSFQAFEEICSIAEQREVNGLQYLNQYDIFFHAWKIIGLPYLVFQGKCQF